MDQLRVTKVCAKEREHVRLELPVGAARSKPGVSLRISGTASAKAGEQGIKKPKCLEFGTT